MSKNTFVLLYLQSKFSFFVLCWFSVAIYLQSNCNLTLQPYTMVIYIFSPWQVVCSLSISLFSVLAELSTLPTALFSPTRMQPSVSSWVFPRWMRMPSNPFTPMRIGSILPKRGETVSSIRYLPVGIAVVPLRFSACICEVGIVLESPRSVSSSVSQKYSPLMNNLPMV